MGVPGRKKNGLAHRKPSFTEQKKNKEKFFSILCTKGEPQKGGDQQQRGEERGEILPAPYLERGKEGSGLQVFARKRRP